jgi:hypothetical protein
MRTNLSPLRVQHWTLLGFNPWHRVLLRQSIADVAAGLGICPLFHVFEQQAVASIGKHEQSGLISGAHVIVITKEAFLAISSSHESPFTRSLSKDRIILLWDRTALGKETLSWATCIGFAGVIYDLATLHGWSTIAVQRGMSCLEEPHPILSQIELPTLTRIGADV